MEENNFTQASNETPGEPSLTISRPAVSYLLETSKWAKFLSIMGFILTGIIVVVALFAGSIMSAMSQGQANNMPKGAGFFLSFIYLIVGILYFFPSWYLFRFSQKLQLALTSKDSNELVMAFANQKSLYKFWGIFTIVIVTVYALVFLFFLFIYRFR